MRHIIVLDLLTDTCKQDDGDQESNGNTDTVYDTLNEVVALLYVCQRNTENRTVCCN